MFLEIFVGFIQAFIFGMLITVFIAMSLTHEEEGHDTKKVVPT
jgi:F0F1-type ATP synthase membrane subunit a